jgi:hypothetical protein
VTGRYKESGADIPDAGAASLLRSGSEPPAGHTRGEEQAGDEAAGRDERQRGVAEVFPHGQSLLPTLVVSRLWWCAGMLPTLVNARDDAEPSK